MVIEKRDSSQHSLSTDHKNTEKMHHESKETAICLPQILYVSHIQGLVNVPFWGYWTSPYSSHYRPYTQWLGDVQWGHLMTHDILIIKL